ncbi:MAG TPA: GlsB/YeaQ/YmgE family stress response membrane protein [Pirellulales bacterium]|nr:GlsB/YeaQ/YmgE family stress response membrane protein [Pirellulales bacterium]
MGGPETYQTLEHLAHDALTWVGFGLLAGLLAKAIMPGRDPGGPVATLIMGCGGSVIGSGMLALIGGNRRVTPISPLGFAVATTGAFVLLFFYRLLAGRIIREDGEGYGSGLGRAPYYRRSRTRRTYYED